MFDKKPIFCLFLALILVLSAQTFQTATANPIPSPMLQLDSPQDNQIYPSNVWLNFSPSPYTGINFTSFSYSLDGQVTKGTDGHTLLTDLAGGSHTIEIYGNGTTVWGNEQKVNMLLDIAYFGVGYSTQWVVFTVLFVAVVVLSLLALYINRAAFARRLRAKKKPSFWLGTVSTSLGLVMFIPWLYGVLYEYLFPIYPRGLGIYFAPVMYLMIFFIAAGFALMVYGTRKSPKDGR